MSRLARTVHTLAHATGWSLRRARRAGALRIVMLHGIPRDQAPLLGRQLRWIRQRFEPIRLSTLLARLEDPKAITGREVVLTFDDGLRNNATVVAPLLARHEVPATFFVCPGLIASQRWLWNHDARERLTAASPEARTAVRDLLPGATPLHEGASIDTAVEALIDAMKDLDPSARDRVAEEIRERTPDFEPTEAQREAYDIMDAETLCGLDPTWIDIGSHTMDHPILTGLDEAGIRAQLVDSRAELEALLSRPVPHFCYPNGAEDARVRAVAREVYDAAVTTEPGVVTSDADRHGLPRIGIPDSVATLAWRFHRP